MACGGFATHGTVLPCDICWRHFTIEDLGITARQGVFLVVMGDYLAGWRGWMALTAAAALLVVAPLRILGGFAGKGRRFRHGPGLLCGF